MIKKYKQFFTKDLWRGEHEHLSKFRQSIVRLLRVVILAYRGFVEDNVLLRSSALTFYTLISIVPVVALAFGVAKGFGFDEQLDELITNYFGGQEEVSSKLIEFSHSSLDTAKGGVIAGMGLLMLFWSVIKVLTNIELSFNAVWGIKQPRTVVKKFTEYLSIMLIAPVFILASGAVTAFISSAATHALSSQNFFFHLGPIFKILIELIPYVLIWALFAFLYVAIPNTKVKAKHAIIAGVIAGTCFNVLEWVYFTLQIGAVQKNAVYGSFAALPLFLVWIQSSWIIVLFGCELAFAGQNVKRFVYEKEINSISLSHKRKISILLLLNLNRNFNQGKAAPTLDQLCEKHSLPMRLVQTITNEFVAADLVSEVTDDNSTTRKYALSKNIGDVQLSEIMSTLDSYGNSDIQVKSKKDWENINSSIKEILDSARSNEKNVTLNELS